MQKAEVTVSTAELSKWGLITEISSYLCAEQLCAHKLLSNYNTKTIFYMQ